MSPRLALHLLGPPRLELDNSLATIDRRKTLALLAYLAVNHWQHHRDHISAMLWPDYDQAKAFTNLRHILWEIQQLIGDHWIVASRDTIGLIPNTGPSSERIIWLDVAHFQSLLAESRIQNDISLRLPLLMDSVKLYRDHFLTGFSLKDAPGFNEWAFGQADNLRQQLAFALSMLADDYCSLGKAETAIPHAKRLVTLDPLNEASHRQLMDVYIQADQHGAALKQYQICERILRKELNIDPQPETRALYKRIRKGEIKPIPLIKQKEVSAPPHNLPYQISTFIGRERELDEVADLIADHRLVTLVGTGGIGKTRLSLKIGEGLLKEYADGIWFVELASLNDPVHMPRTVATLFNLTEGSEESLTEKLIRVLRLKTMLLILDNCEHLLDACAQLADTLLRSCPNLKILTSSREPLGITGEAQYHVPPLALPNLQQILERLLDFASIQLFEERARLIQEHFSLTMENAASIVQICHRLDGIPLAIELAAARVNTFSTEQIATQLHESFNLLTGGSRTALPRQQTLHASIEWSWKLLTDSEQILLRRLAIFVGGWVQDAAESVCTGNGLETQKILNFLTQLMSKSLVVERQGAGRERRYHLLEMIREYAHEKLVEAGEEEGIRDQHLKYFLKLSEQIEPGLIGPQQIEWSVRTSDEQNNLRSALEQAAKTSVEAGLLICGRLNKFWERFDTREGIHWLGEFLQRPESNHYPLARAKALCTQGWLLYWFQKFDMVHSAAEECLALYRSVGDQHGEVDGLILLGFVSDIAKKDELLQQALTLARSLGDAVRQRMALAILGWDQRDFERACAYWEEAITLSRQLGNWHSLAETLSTLGLLLVLNGHIESGQVCLDESSTLFGQMNAKGGKIQLLTAYGQIALMRGDYEQARAYFQEYARLSDELGSRMDYLWAMARLGYVELSDGNISEARQIFGETIKNFQQDRNTIGVVFALEGIASLNITIGKAEESARLIGWADATRAVIGESRQTLEQADADRDIAAVVVRIGNAAFEEAYDKGRAMTLDEAVAYALDETPS